MWGGRKSCPHTRAVNKIYGSAPYLKGSGLSIPQIFGTPYIESQTNNDQIQHGETVVILEVSHTPYPGLVKT